MKKHQWQLAGTMVVLAGILGACGGQKPAASSPASTAGQAPASKASGSSSGTAMAPAWSALYKAAQSKGPVVMEGPTHVKDMSALLAAFKSQFPKVKVEYQSLESGKIESGLLTQEAAKNVQIDLAELGMDRVGSLDANHAVASVDWAKMGVSGELVNQAFPQFVKWYDFPSAIAYNTKLVTKSQAPANWNDLLKPQWANGAIANQSTGSYASVLFNTWGTQKTLNFAKALGKQKPVEELRADLAMQALISGQTKLATVGAVAAYKAMKQGAPIALAPVSPQFNLPFVLMVPQGAPNQPGAELLAAWLVQPPQRAIFAKASGYGLVTPCSASPLAGYLCQQHIQVQGFSSLTQIQSASSNLIAYQKAMGIYKGH